MLSGTHPTPEARVSWVQMLISQAGLRAFQTSSAAKLRDQHHNVALVAGCLDAVQRGAAYVALPAYGADGTKRVKQDGTAILVKSSIAVQSSHLVG